jgi:hypothetical protein
MSRIDVVPAEKGKFKVLINYVQRGVDYASAKLANTQARKVHTEMPHATIKLAKE